MKLVRSHNIPLLSILGACVFGLGLFFTSTLSSIGIFLYIYFSVMIPLLVIFSTLNVKSIYSYAIVRYSERNLFLTIILFLFICFYIYSIVSYIGINDLSIESILSIANKITHLRYLSEESPFNFTLHLLGLFVYPIFIYIIFTEARTKSRYKKIDLIVTYATLFSIFFIPFIMGSKSMLVLLVILFFISKILKKQSCILSNIKFFMGVFFSIVLAFMIMIFLHYNRVSDGVDFLFIVEKVIMEYFLAPAILFTKWVEYFDINILPQDFGYNTFLGVAKYLIHTETTRSNFISFDIGDTTYISNVYTGYKWVLLDFGIIFSSIFFAVIYYLLIVSVRSFYASYSILKLTLIVALAIYILFLPFGSVYKYLTNYFTLFGFLLIYLGEFMNKIRVVKK